MSEVIELSTGQWVELPIGKAAVIRHKKGSGQVLYCQSSIQPVDIDDTVSIFEETVNGEKIYVNGVFDGEKVYARAVIGTCFISVINRDSAGAPDGLYEGLRAQTVQFYTEANVKNGVQFYLRKAYTLQTPIASGQSRYLVFSTTSKKVIFKSRIVSYIGEELALELFVNPDLSNNGQPITVGNYNGINPVATTVQAYHAPVIVSEGTPLDQEAEYYFGGSSAGQRVSNSIPEGRERVLPENTTFLIKITNTGSGNGRFQYFGDWYEGDPDLPLA